MAKQTVAEIISALVDKQLQQQDNDSPESDGYFGGEHPEGWQVSTSPERRYRDNKRWLDE